MTIRVLVVDDSGFFRRRVKEILESDSQLEVVGMAENGEQAIELTKSLKPDVITMDIEMPVMDGITATRKIMQSSPTAIIMFSSLTTEGARATLDALDAGALDFLPKRFEDISKNREEANTVLCKRVKLIAYKNPAPSKPVVQARSALISDTKPAAASAHPPTLVRRSKGKINLVAIGTSTGGPVALQKVLTQIPGDFPVPILVIQHMPGSFTTAFAERLDQQCKIRVKEAEHRDKLEKGVAYIAPGGKQMLIEANGAGSIIKIDETMPDLTYKPSVDITFGSVSKIYPNETLAVILTGMGSDGCKGARMLKEKGSTIWAQDENSSVIYGMPAAIVDAGIAERILDIDEVGKSIAQRV